MVQLMMGVAPAREEASEGPKAGGGVGEEGSARWLASKVSNDFKAAVKGGLGVSSGWGERHGW